MKLQVVLIDQYQIPAKYRRGPCFALKATVKGSYRVKIGLGFNLVLWVAPLDMIVTSFAVNLVNRVRFLCCLLIGYNIIVVEV